MKTRDIVVTNAREHNLKNINITIPRRSLTVITGISGSGKSSLAFDTIYAEGNRRYVESLSTYARQFIDVIRKPDVENIEGLSPVLAINQRTITHNPRSTVGTMTDVYDYLRLLYAKIGVPYCYQCGKPIQPKTVDEIVKDYTSLDEGAKLLIFSPIVRGKKGEYSSLLQKLRAEGFSKAFIDGKLHSLEENIKLDKNKIHEIDLLVDKIVINKNVANRLSESISLAIRLSGGFLKTKIDNNEAVIISDKHSCVDCGISYPEIEPRTFSFNSPYGACPTCNGIGTVEKKSGDEVICPECNGSRLKKESLSIKINERPINELSTMSIGSLNEYLKNSSVEGNKKVIADKIIKEILERLNFIIDVGLGYLTLNRTGYSLSGGEAQRVRLATQLGSGLTGVLYVLDEPSIGLHPHDNQKLINSLLKLKEKGNTIIIVEHDEDTIRSADHLIDLGPGAGVYGGKVVAEGDINSVIANQKSLTGLYLSSKLKIAIPIERKKDSGRFLTISDVKTNNLKNISVSFPVGLMISVTGVSGSGKSSLIEDSLVPALYSLFDIDNPETVQDKYKINGIEHIDRVINIDQAPIGQTPRSNPATYTDIFLHIRNLFAQLPDSKARGYGSGRFSFNVHGGRCDVCQGAGLIKIEMKFMPDVFVTCDTCKGAKFNGDTLEIKYKGKNISEILNMTVEEGMLFFKNISYIHHKLKTLHDVGLGYIKLGQSSVTLSGGEAQRIKLSKELVKRTNGKNLYILDEPTTGLHFDDVKKLIAVLHRLRDQGNTIVVIEHNMEVIKTSDYVIDLGPEGGEAGGYVVATGTPEQVAANPLSKTGECLKKKISGVLNERHN
ncbi:MAG: excinuclease ABC subunit UvrA [Pseudomonadota bacterium]